MFIQLRKVFPTIVKATFLIFLVTGINLSLAYNSANAHPPVSVKKAPEGFTIALPATTINKSGFNRLKDIKVELNLSDPNLGVASVHGSVVRTAKNRLLIKTDDRLSYLPTNRTLITLIRPEVVGLPPCLETDLAPFVGVCKITYCPSTIVCSDSLNCMCLD